MSSIEQLISNIQAQFKNDHDSEQFYQYLQQYNEMQQSETSKHSICDHIVSDFVSKNMFFYNKTSKLYFNYINNHYVPLNEDNMLHYVLEFITNFKTYRSSMNVNLKMMIKGKIIKSIRENSIYETIPDTDTIQTILNMLYPNIFKQKEYCKIFLLMIGNIVLKKRNNQKYIIFMRSEIKTFLNDVNKYISTYFCNHNLFSYFKFKFTQDHVDQDSWVIPCNPICYGMYHFTEQFFVNLICVSIYYANRYDSVDKYLDSVVGDVEQVRKTVYFLNEESRSHIIEDYFTQYMIQKEDEYINQKDLLYLWKRYITENDLFVYPFVSYQEFLIRVFQRNHQEFVEGNTHNMLKGYCSMEIPDIELFRSFWDEYFTFCDDEFYFETSEILHLFHQKHKQKKISISESSIVLILQSYYTQFSIINEKTVHNVRCNIWDKKKVIDQFIEKEKINVRDNVHTLYRKYTEYEKNLKISKKYFTMYMEQLREI